MNVISGIRQFLIGPVDACYKTVARFHERTARNKPPCQYTINEDWRQQLGVSDDDREQTDRLCRTVEATLIAQGIRPGPQSYLTFNDGDPAFLQAIWCLVRNLHATKIVETGVAHGGTSLIILEALAGRGHLWSIDLPPAAAPELHREIGAAVGTWPPEQWTLILGPSRRRLPRLLASVAPIDIFVHDSEHSEYNMRFEMNRAWDALRPGGALVVDDVDLNWAFEDFSRTVVARKLIAESEPIRPDTRRFNQKGLFGILIKP